MSAPANKPAISIAKALKNDSIRVSLSIVIVVIVTSFFSKYFFTVSNLESVLRGQSIIAIMAIGQLLVILVSGIDISIGSVFGLSGAVAAVLLLKDVPLVYCLFFGVACGALVGATNGFLISRFNLAPFIVTLGMMGIVRGLSYILTGATSISIENPLFLAIDSSSVLFIPFPILLLVLLALAFSALLNTTVFGSRLYAIGGDEQAAKMLGIPILRSKIVVYTVSGILAAVAGIVGASKVSSSYPLAGSGYEFEVIAAVIIGGAAMEGGKGTVLGVVLGAMFIGIMKNSIIQVGVSQYWQQTLSGFVIILVLMISILMSKSRKR